MDPGLGATHNRFFLLTAGGIARLCVAGGPSGPLRSRSWEELASAKRRLRFIHTQIEVMRLIEQGTALLFSFQAIDLKRKKRRTASVGGRGKHRPARARPTGWAALRSDNEQMFSPFQASAQLF